MADRLILSEAIDAVASMLAGFPNGAPQNSQGYIGALAAVLMEYPRSVALACSSRKQGIVRTTRFLPTIADIVAWCDQHTAEMRQPIDREERDRQFAQEHRRMAAEAADLELQRKTRPSYDELKAKHGPTWGLQAGEKAKRAKPIHDAGRRLFEAECKAAGLDPSSLVSPRLIKLLGQRV